MEKKTVIRSVVSLWAFLALTLYCPAQNAVPTVQGGPWLIQGMRHTISPALRDIPPVVPKAEAKHEVENEFRYRTTIEPNAPLTDWALQSQNSASSLASNASFGLNFDGIGAGFNGFNLSSAPPDTNGAVGATQFVQSVNASFAVFSKATGALEYGAADISTLFKALGGECSVPGETDPVVVYDKLANRWLVSIINGSTPNAFAECFAVSTSSDATGTYNLYDIPFGTSLPDYPKWGVWADAYYMTADTNGGETACALNRAKILNGQSLTTGDVQCFGPNGNRWGLMPADMDGTTPPPSGEPNFFIGLGSQNASNDSELLLFRFHVDFTTPANSTFNASTPTSITVATYSPLCNNGNPDGGNAGACVPQYQSTQLLDTLNFTPMFRLAYRNFGSSEALVVTHNVDAGSSGGVRWYQITNPNGTPVVAQQGTFAPDSNWRWMGSMAMDSAGDLGVGYSLSSGEMFPAIAVSAQTPSDTVNTLEQETVVFEGSGSQQPTLNRWGDYSAMTVDPVDDCTFWYTTEYIPSNGAFNWHTRIISFKMNHCTPAVAAGADFTVASSQAAVNVTPGNSDSSTVITVSPENGYTGTVNLTAAVTGAPAGVTVSLNPTSVTSGSGTSALTINTTTLTPGGNFPIVITAKDASGSPIHQAYVSLATPGFSLTTSGINLSVNQGAATTSTFTVNSFNGFNGGVNFSTTGLPSGVTATFSPNPATANSTLTLTATATAATTVPVPVTITASSGNLTQKATLNVAVSAATGTGGSGTPVNLSSVFNLNGIYVDGSKFSSSGGLDGVGSAYSGNLLTANRILSGVQFNFGAADSSTVTSTNAVYGNGSAITLAAAQQGQYSGLQLLATGIEGNQQTQTITVTYTDNSTTQFTQSFSDWFTPQKYPGELEGVAMVYRDISDGSQDNRPFNLYGYSFALNSAKTLKSITLPNNRNVVVLAATLAGAAGTYTLSASPSAVSLPQGSNQTSTITVTPSGGFSGSVSLTASGLPSGVTASFNPTSTTTTSALTLTATSTATTGAATVTVTGTSGTLTQTATVNLTVTPPAASYSLSAAAPSQGTISPGGSSQSTISITSSNGYTGSVTLSCSVAPVVSPAATCSFGSTSPAQVTSSGGSATLTFNTVAPSVAARRASVFYVAVFPISALALLSFGFGSQGSRRKRILGFILLSLILATLILLPACGGGGNGGGGGGGGGNPGTPAGTYTVTITGKDASGTVQSNPAPTVSVVVN